MWHKRTTRTATFILFIRARISDLTVIPFRMSFIEVRQSHSLRCSGSAGRFCTIICIHFNHTSEQPIPTWITDDGLTSSCLLNGIICAPTIGSSEPVKTQRPLSLDLSAAVKLFRVVDGGSSVDAWVMTASTSIAWGPSKSDFHAFNIVAESCGGPLTNIFGWFKMINRSIA